MTSDRAFLGVSALLFVASASLTIVWCASMPPMAMPMPGGWMMTMAWMRMPGQSWPGAAASFVAMWTVMMVAMMLPVLVPMLRRYRRVVALTGTPRLGRLTGLVAAGYFFVWTTLGAAVYPFGVALATLEMQYPPLSRAVPIATGIVVTIAGALQFTTWKKHHLNCCRDASSASKREASSASMGNSTASTPRHAHTLAADAWIAWRHGLRLGLHCSYCSVGLTAILLVAGVMDLKVMAMVTAAVVVERLVPNAERAAHGLGAVVVAAGLMLITQALASA